MKNKILLAILVFAFLFCLQATSCSGQTINNPKDLEAYLDKQPANRPDKPIKVTMTINDLMLEDVADVINSAGKYVSLNLTGNALKTISDGAFQDSETLVSITIPNSVTEIGICAFAYCTSLTSVTIPNSVTYIDLSTFTGCTSLTSVIIPNSVTIIGSEAFSECESLTSVIIGNSVTSILDGAFWGCYSLTKITIPKSVTEIGEGAFAGCGLTSVTFQGTIKPLNFGSDAFEGNLRETYLKEGIGTYTTTNNPNWDSVWTKK